MSCPGDAVHVIGGGLAGSECAWQLARQGVPVVLHEMRPERLTPAHKSGDFAELVCSNSFRSDDPHHAAGLLKREMATFSSLIMAAARQAAVPAGGALAVDRQRYAEGVTVALEGEPLIEIRRGEVTELPEGDVVLATGPLTSKTMSEVLGGLLGDEYLYFYDAIAPIVNAESLDMSVLFAASRYGKGGGDDYLNAPMDREQYLAFHQAVVDAEVVPLHGFEKNLFFEGCLPIEEMARRGVDTLRFGPMKPVGLTRPDGSKAYAIVQLRQETLARSHYNLVGFQSRMTWDAQKRVLRMIPGLEKARFERLGQAHRNTFVNAPKHLDKLYRLKAWPRLRLAGQITGVEGYLESAATGIAVALYLALERRGCEPEPLPGATALGTLARHLTESEARNFQPANINYGLFEPLDDPGLRGRKGRQERRRRLVERALAELEHWRRGHGFGEQEAEKPAEVVAGAGKMMRAK